MSNKYNKEDLVLSNDESMVKHALDSHLDAEVDNLDFNVTNKLAAARKRALSQEPKHSAWLGFISWQTAVGGVAAVSLAYVVSNQVLNTTPVINSTPETPVVAETGNTTLMEDITILAEGEDIEFYQNLEFLEWLETNS